MPDDKSNFEKLSADDAVIARIPDGEEAWRLLDAVLDDRASRQEIDRLEQLAVTSPAIARLCIRGTHLWYGLQLHVRQSHIAGEARLEELERTEGTLDGGLNETMVLPALREEELAAPMFRDPLFDAIPPDAPPEWVIPPRQPRHWTWVAAAAAVVAAVTGLTIWPSRPDVRPIATGSQPMSAGQNPATGPTQATATTTQVRYDAVLSATTAAVFDNRPAPDPGTPLTTGGRVRLTSGAVEIKFDSGAVAVVTAPAQFRITDRNAMALESGSLAASVPPPAVGFSVIAPGLTVIDQGTNFGVRTRENDAATEAAVFEGKVDALATNAAREVTAEPVRLTAGQAVQHDLLSGKNAPIAIPYKADGYTREIEKFRLPLDLVDTGEGVTPIAGTPTPDWQIIAVPNDPAWTPQNAVITAVPSHPAASTFADMRWISSSPREAALVPGDYVFRTRIDLTGFDPGSVNLSVKAICDGEIVEFRANGATAAVHRATPGRVTAYELELTGLRWVSGMNDVDVVVRTRAQQRRTTAPMALAVRWTGTASPLVRR